MIKFIPHETSIFGLGEGIASIDSNVFLSSGSSVRVHKKDQGGVDNWGLVQSISVIPLLEDRGWTVPGGIGDPTITCNSANIIYWTGLINSDWNFSNNWSTIITVPGEGDIVIIPFSDNQPILDVSTPAIKRIEILNGAILTIKPNGNLNLEE